MPSFLKKSCANVIYGIIKKQNKKMGTQPFFNPENYTIYKKNQMGNFLILKKSIGGNPDIFGPQHECGACGGGGCSRCS
jgi:hypothetical protein